MDEDEKLFIGGLGPMRFKTIRNMARSPVQNYKVYVQAMSMFSFITQGAGWNPVSTGIKIKKSHGKSLQLLITEEMDGKYAMSSDLESVIPRYVMLLFHHSLHQVRDLEIDWCYFKERDWWYSHLAPVLSNDDGSELNLDIYLRILPNIRSIHIYNTGWNKMPSFPLDLSLKSKLLSAVKDINERNAVCSSIALVRPIGDLDKFIDENNAEFQMEGWHLEKKPVNGLRTSYKPHPDTLCVMRKE